MRPSNPVRRVHESKDHLEICRIVDISPTNARRADYVQKFGSPQILNAMETEEISIWRAFCITKKKTLKNFLSRMEKRRQLTANK